MPDDELAAATDRLNAGQQVPTLEPSLIERWWELVSRIPREQRQGRTIGLGAIAGGPDALPMPPDQQVALMARFTLLDALVEHGVLDDYMQDASLRAKVFAAAATLPLDKNDLGEALAQKLLRESPPDASEKAKEEFRQAGYDPDHPKIGEKFIAWMRDRS